MINRPPRGTVVVVGTAVESDGESVVVEGGSVVTVSVSVGCRGESVTGGVSVG
jgi:hypothetical protein